MMKSKYVYGGMLAFVIFFGVATLDTMSFAAGYFAGAMSIVASHLICEGPPKDPDEDEVG